MAGAVISTARSRWKLPTVAPSRGRPGGSTTITRRPGAGYMHLLFILDTQRIPSERKLSVAGNNRFIQQGFGTNFIDAELTFRLKGELLPRDAQLYLLCQGTHDNICTGWLLTGEPISVTKEWSEHTVHCQLDADQWTSMGSRHDRTETYGHRPLGNRAGRRQRGYSVGALSLGHRTDGTTRRGSAPITSGG